MINMLIAINDDENAPNDLSKHDFIGSADFKLSEVVSGLNQTAKFQVATKQNAKPMAIITAEEKKKGGSTVVLQFTAPLSSDGHFFIIWKKVMQQWKPVYKSEGSTYQRGTQVWREAILDSNMLADNDDSQIRIDFMLAQDSGDHRLVGSINTCLASLKNGER